MHYSTQSNDHGMRHDPFKALIVPRPIGWISTVSADGALNLAPYSFFNGVSDRPPMVMFSSAGTRTRCATCAKRANSPARSRAGICAAR